MAKKVMQAPRKRVRGLIVVRNVDLGVWDDFKKFAENLEPEAKLGPLLTQAMRDYMEQRKH